MLQGVPFLPQFMICLWEVLNLIIYQRLRSHFFPEYGRFAFWTENLIKSQFYGPLWHLKVKCSILSFSPKLLKIKQKDKLYTNILSISWLLWKHNEYIKCQNWKIFKTCGCRIIQDMLEYLDSIHKWVMATEGNGEESNKHVHRL